MRQRDSFDLGVSTNVSGERPSKRVPRPRLDPFMAGLFALQAVVRAEEAGEELPRGATRIEHFLAPTAEDDADGIPLPRHLLESQPKTGGK